VAERAVDPTADGTPLNHERPLQWRNAGFSRFFLDNYLNDHKAVKQNHGSAFIPGEPG
jgi:hypothetical protein